MPVVFFAVMGGELYHDCFIFIDVVCDTKGDRFKILHVPVGMTTDKNPNCKYF